MTKDEMVGWHHRHNGHEFAQRRLESQLLQGCCVWSRALIGKKWDLEYKVGSNNRVNALRNLEPRDSPKPSEPEEVAHFS